ncbi:hypothetical protein AVEN_204877-1, partial [Araneus ventricosus]
MGMFHAETCSCTSYSKSEPDSSRSICSHLSECSLVMLDCKVR